MDSNNFNGDNGYTTSNNGYTGNNNYTGYNNTGYNNTYYSQPNYSNTGYNTNGYQQNPMSNTQWNTPQPTNNNGLAVASMILGILSLISMCFIYYGFGIWLSLIFSIIAIILGACSKNKTGPYAGLRPSMGLAGLIMGIVALAIDIILLMLTIFFAAALLGHFSNRNNWY